MSAARLVLAAVAWLAALPPVALSQPAGQAHHATPAAAATAPDAARAGSRMSPPAAGARDEAARQYFTDRRLVDQNGLERRFYTDVLQHRVVLINFIFTSCQDTSPNQSQKLSEEPKLLKGEAGRGNTLVSNIIDPERDTPHVLKAFSQRYEAGDGWLFLTGEPQAVREVVRKLGQLGPSVEEHSTLFILGNVDTGHWMKLRPDTSAQAIARHLQVLASEKPARPGAPG